MAKRGILRPTLLVILTSILLALAFPAPSLGILAWLFLIPLLFSVQNKNFLQSFKLSFFAGFLANIGIFYWLNIVMTTYGHLPLVLSILLTLMLSAYLALYIAFPVALAIRAEKSGISLILSLPLLWVAFEYLRGILLSGFPWAILGYTQYRTLSIIQIADITGVYGISFLIILGNVVIYKIIKSIISKEEAKYPVAGSLVLLALLVITVWYGFVRLNEPNTGRDLKVGLVQGNISQDIKWDPNYLESTLEVYERLTRDIAGQNLDLIVWPESSLPFYFQRDIEHSTRVKNFASEIKSYLVVGSPAVETTDNVNFKLFNSAFLINPYGEVIGRGDKTHLVPFGEYVPMSKMLPFVHKMVHGIGDFSPGATISPLSGSFGNIGILVCFEGIFPEISREYVKKGANLLVNITNDAWFGRSSAPYQDLSMTVFRAVENKVPLIRAANSGITAIIDSRGHIHGMTPLFKEATLTGKIRLSDEKTIYTAYGDIFAWLCLLGAGIIILIPFLKSRRKSEIE
ncbi:MAG: apolipoprotein N-acyltransferase [Desulfuromonadales bacterium]|nr:apolipoprotein N-acyltransferase [Desulfuromonadales bacterium]